MPVSDSFIGVDGKNLRLWRWPNKPGRPTLHWAHATGFHARLYQPLLDALSQHVNVIAWDARGHGESRDVGDISRFNSWNIYYRDLAALIEQQPEPVWLAGHSFGAMTSMAAATLLRDKVAGVLLVEPVIVDRKTSLLVATGKLFGQTHRLPIAAGAARRRERFDTRQQALDVYRRKSSFKGWQPGWLDHYVEHGFVDEEQGVTLACRPAWEARSFSVMEHRPMKYARIFPQDKPLHILVGEKDSTFWPKARLQLQQHIGHAQVDAFNGTSHFLPMEKPQQLLNWIVNKLPLQD